MATKHKNPPAFVERAYWRAMKAEDAFTAALSKAGENRWATPKSASVKKAYSRKVKADAAYHKAVEKMRRSNPAGKRFYSSQPAAEKALVRLQRKGKSPSGYVGFDVNKRKWFIVNRNPPAAPKNRWMPAAAVRIVKRAGKTILQIRKSRGKR